MMVIRRMITLGITVVNSRPALVIISTRTRRRQRIMPIEMNSTMALAMLVEMLMVTVMGTDMGMGMGMGVDMVGGIN